MSYSFPEVSTALTSNIIIPVTTASAERSFSKLESMKRQDKLYNFTILSTKPSLNFDDIIYTFA